jgi:hypothetical protein
MKYFAWEVVMGGWQFKASLGKKKIKCRETLSQKSSSAWWYVCIIPDIREVEVRETPPKVGAGQNHKTLTKK